MTETPWIVRFAPISSPAHRLFCFPYAGIGSSLYRLWPKLVPDGVEICAILPPGREGRIREKAMESIDEICDALLPALTPWLDRPFSFFGHSLGALVAFESARRIRTALGRLPETLFVSARIAPHLPSSSPSIHHLSDALFIEAMKKRYGGIPDVILQSPDLMALFLPVMRADMKAVETYLYREDAPLECPIMAFAGTRDAVADERGVRAWSMHTTSGFDFRAIEGDHFFVQSARAKVAGEVSSALGKQGTGIDPDAHAKGGG